MTESPQIRALKERYKTSFADKIDLLKTLRSDLNDGGDNYDEIHASLHKLAGSSGMYGYDDICRLCRATMESVAVKELSDVASGLGRTIRLLERYCEL